jgi:hypothetical protein
MPLLLLHQLFCRFAGGCSRECQLAAWKDGGHKQQCAQLKATFGSVGGLA